MNPDIGSPLALSLAVGAGAVALAFVPALALARFLSRRDFPGRRLVEAAALLPLVLPPVVTGLLLLFVFGRESALGRLLASAGAQLVFNVPAMMLAGAVVAFPLLLRSMQAALANVDPGLEEAAATLGWSSRRVFFKITLPLARTGVLAGVVLGFARAVGEFGATVMVSANTPGQRTLALEIYRLAGSPGHENAVWALAAVSAALGLGALWTAESLIHDRGSK